MNQPHKLVLPISASHRTAEEQQKRLEWLEAWKGLPPLVTKSDVNQKKTPVTRPMVQAVNK